MICNIKKYFYNNYSSYEVYIPDYVRFICKPGDDGKVDTPVPIPNTEVKHFIADGSTFVRE